MGKSSTLGYYSRKCHVTFSLKYSINAGSHEERVNEEVKEEEDMIMTSGWNFKSLTFNLLICQYIHQLDEQNTLIIL
jgi:hypothetical protein